MIELVELEAHREEFAKRRTRVLAVSNDNQVNSRTTKEEFPSLVVVADSDDELFSATGAAAPVTILIDNGGTVRGVYRPSHKISRFADGRADDGGQKSA